MGLYTSAIFQYRRRKTRQVRVGDVGVGGDNPIRVQSMTISDTKDTAAVVKETRGLVEAGCEIVRITAPTIHHAENLKEIKKQLRQEGIRVPLVADIHFTPQAAMIAADHVEKVRINPGNYADRKLFAIKEYTDEVYQAELDRMAEKFIPLVRKCKANGVAMRIGTNHGSLSDRIMNRYGDTPLGMVESALEFVRLCESESYHDIILSMKASSPFIMIAAYRLLAQRMDELGMDYPFHLGVTEAGEGEDGRVKSAIGIGSLLEDGIGDTIRVSLTEDSIHEIPVAQALVKKFNAMNGKNRHSDIAVSSEITWDPIERRRRQALQVSSGDLKIGGENPIGVALSYDPARDPGGEALEIFLQEAEADTCGDWISFQGAWDSKAFAASRDQLLARFPKLKIGVQVNEAREAEAALQEFSAVVFPVAAATQDETLRRLAAAASQQKKILELRFSSADQALERLAALGEMSSVLLSLATDRPIQEYRRLAAAMDRAGVKLPLHLIVLAQDTEEPVLAGSSALGSLLMDGIGDSVEVSGISLSESARLAFNTLQASRLRISKAEFIACPSCGRTLFDLQETTQRIKKKTAHLKGVKIAIMGCIVNGPGEMADADFGYVGGGPGKIHLYVGKECVEKNIPTAVADEKLIQLIKTHDRWIDPPSPTLSS